MSGLFQGLVETLRGFFSSETAASETDVEEPDAEPPTLYRVSWERVDGSGGVTEISLDDPAGAIETKDNVKRVRFRSVTKDSWNGRNYDSGKPRWRLAVWRDVEPNFEEFDPRTEWPVNERHEPRVPISGDGWDE